MRIASYIALLLISEARRGVLGRSVHTDDSESVASLFQDVLKSLDNDGDYVYDDQEAIEDTFSIFNRNRRSHPLRCSFHNLCYCRSKLSRKEFCCDCSVGPCFPATSVVHTSDGDVLMKDLRIGHKILTVNAEGQLVYSRVEAFLDRRPSGQAEYLLLKTVNGRTIQISANHLIFTYKDNVTSLQNSRFAGGIKVNDYVSVLDEERVERLPITEISRKVLDGAYVPLTEHGTLIVDGVLASCYASYGHSLVHFFLTPVRWFPGLFNQPTSQPNGVMPYVNFLKHLANLFLPSQFKGNHIRTAEVDIFRQELHFNPATTVSCPK